MFFPNTCISAHVYQTIWFFLSTYICVCKKEVKASHDVIPMIGFTRKQAGWRRLPLDTAGREWERAQRAWCFYCWWCRGISSCRHLFSGHRLHTSQSLQERKTKITSSSFALMGHARHERSSGDFRVYWCERLPDTSVVAGLCDLMIQSSQSEQQQRRSSRSLPSILIRSFQLYRSWFSPRNPAVLSSSRTRCLDSENDGWHMSGATLLCSLAPSELGFHSYMSGNDVVDPSVYSKLYLPLKHYQGHQKVFRTPPPSAPFF